MVRAVIDLQRGELRGNIWRSGKDPVGKITLQAQRIAATGW